MNQRTPSQRGEVISHHPHINSISHSVISDFEEIGGI